MRRRDLLKIPLGAVAAACTSNPTSPSDAGDDGALDAAVDVRSRDGGGLAPVDRILFVHTQHGTWLEEFTPTRAGSGLTLSPILTPLETLKNKLLVVGGVSLSPTVAGLGSTHQYGPAVVLTGLAGPPTTGAVDPGADGAILGGGPSIDHRIATALGTSSPPVLGVLMSESIHHYWVSHRGAGEPVQPENDPLAAFESLFAGVSPTPEITALHERLSDGLDPSDNDAYVELLSRQLSVMLEAFRHDRCRVGVIQAGWAVPSLVTRFLDTVEPLHDALHADGRPTLPPVDVAREVVVGTQAHLAAQLASLAEQLAATPTSDGLTALDHTLIVWISETGEARGHGRRDLPFVVIGNASGKLDTGALFETDRPQMDALLTLAYAVAGLERLEAPDVEASLVEEMLNT